MAQAPCCLHAAPLLPSDLLAVTLVNWLWRAADVACTASPSPLSRAQGLPSISPNASCTAFISNTSVALSLLLVFRTNSSYGRWDEARKMWGGLLNRSRDIMRQSATCFPDDQVGTSCSSATALPVYYTTSHAVVPAVSAGLLGEGATCFPDEQVGPH